MVPSTQLLSVSRATGKSLGTGNSNPQQQMWPLVLHPSLLSLMFVRSRFFCGGKKNSIHAIGRKTATARESTWEKPSGTNLEITGVMQWGNNGITKPDFK